MCISRWRGKGRDKSKDAVMPSWDETIEIMYGKEMSFVRDVADVIYSTDRSKRFVILKSDIGYYTYVYEKLYAYDQDEWVMLGSDGDPGYWQPEGDGKSFFDSLETAVREIRAEPEYKAYFAEVQIP